MLWGILVHAVCMLPSVFSLKAEKLGGRVCHSVLKATQGAACGVYWRPLVLRESEKLIKVQIRQAGDSAADGGIRTGRISASVCLCVFL